jgi:hypothetical protein
VSQEPNPNDELAIFAAVLFVIVFFGVYLLHVWSLPAEAMRTW